MKLATLKDGSRDGLLLVVSRDLALAHPARGIATRLQQLLDDWNFLSPQLEDLYATLNDGKARHAFPFDASACMAPLPRAHRYAEGDGYASLRERLGGDDRPARIAAAVERAGDDLQGPCDDAVFEPTAEAIDCGAGLAVITGELAHGATAAEALDAVRLLLLVNRWTWRSGTDTAHAAAFGPVAVTPDELGEAWRRGRVHASLHVSVNDRKLGLPDAGEGMDIGFGELLAGLARPRRVRAGALVGGGIVSTADAGKGCASIAERRALEAAEHGAPRTPFLADADRVRIELRGRDGQSVFGALEQAVRGGAPAITHNEPPNNGAGDPP